MLCLIRNERWVNDKNKAGRSEPNTNENAHPSKPSTHQADHDIRKATPINMDNSTPLPPTLLPKTYVIYDKLEEQRLLLQREFRELESQAKDAEKEAHAHSRQSAIGPDGMIIPARARKKRRLDEELEGLLEAMEVLLFGPTVVQIFMAVV